jgi:hypothetical protein
MMARAFVGVLPPEATIEIHSFQKPGFSENDRSQPDFANDFT